MSSYPAYGGQAALCTIIGSILLGLTFILIALRLFVWICISRKGSWSFVWTVATWLGGLATFIVTVEALLYGGANHSAVVLKYDTLDSLLFWLSLDAVLFYPTNALGRIAACVFLLEILARTRPALRITLITVAVYNAAISIPAIVLAWRQCNGELSTGDPASAFDCPFGLLPAYAYFCGASAAATDFALAAIAVAIIAPLQLPRRLKLGLCVLMSSGVLVGACSILRTWSNYTGVTGDPIYDLWVFVVTAELESGLLLVSICVPPAWPVVGWARKRWGSCRSVPGTAYERRVGARAARPEEEEEDASEAAVPLRAGEMAQV